jgi:hypothetical protein
MQTPASTLEHEAPITAPDILVSKKNPIRSRYIWLWLIPLLLLTFWLGARGLNTDGYWVDEVWSLRTAGGPTYGPLSLAGTWESVATIDAWQAPGFYLLLNLWGSIVGWSELATRTISLLFGVLSVAMMYRLGRDVHSPLAGIAAAVALTTSAFYVNFYHELRGYTVYVFLTALCVWSYWRLIHPDKASLHPNKLIGVQIAFTLSVAGLLYTHYFASLTIIIIGIYHLLFVSIDLKRWRGWRMWLRWGNPDWWRIGLLTALGVLFFVPWLNVLLFATRLAQEFPRYTLPPDVMIQSIVNSFSNGNLFLILVLALATPSYSFQSWRTWRLGGSKNILFTWTFVVGWFVVGLIAAQILIMGEVRYFMGIWVALALISGIGIARLARVINPSLLIGGWLLINVWNIYGTGATGNVHWNGWHEPFRELAQVMGDTLRAGDTLFYQLQESVNAWYQSDVSSYYFYGTPAHVVLFEAQPNVPYQTYTAQAHDQVNGTTRIWMAVDPATRPWRTDLLHDTFVESGFTSCGNFASTSAVTVDLYVNLPLAVPAVSLTEPIQNGVIQTALLQPLPEQAGDSLTLIMAWWQDENVPRQTYSTALHILDNTGNLVAQDDYALPYEAATCHISHLDLTSLPSGEYTFAVVVYAWQSQERLRGEEGDSITLGTFQR